jgi:UDP-glucuronate decarboxylase
MNKENFNKILIEDANIISNESLNWSELKNSKILLSGSTGFIASYLVYVLYYINTKKKLNIKIDCIARDKVKAEKIFNKLLDDSNNFLSIKIISITESIELAPTYDYIIHSASIASPKLFRSDPIGVATPNILGTMRLLEFAEKNKLKKFIYFSTTGVNGHVDDKLRPIPENVYGPLDPTTIENSYLESKRMGENLCFAWYAQKSIPIQIVRPAITYGPGVELNDGRSYADFIKSMVKNENITLYSDGSAIRNFCYVGDFIIGLFYVILKGNNGEVYNLSSEEELSIKQLAEDLVSKVFPEKKLSVVYKTNPNDYLRVNFNKTTVSTEKARKLGWKLKFNIKDGMRRTVSSY